MDDPHRNKKTALVWIEIAVFVAIAVAVLAAAH
jgi:hypothetical protein